LPPKPAHLVSGLKPLPLIPKPLEEDSMFVFSKY
jgi:hypothetical protein